MERQSTEGDRTWLLETTIGRTLMNFVTYDRNEWLDQNILTCNDVVDTDPFELWKTQTNWLSIRDRALLALSAFGTSVDCERLWKPATKVLSKERTNLDNNLGAL